MGKLTVKAVESFSPQAKSYLVNDGNGLNLQIHPSGYKYWLFRYRFQHKEKLISLGPFPKTSLQQARLQAMDCHRDLANQIDPGIKRRAEKRGADTDEKTLFKTAAQHWYEGKVKAGRATATLKKMRIYLDKDILPHIGNKQLDEVSRGDCADIQTRIEHRNALNISHKVRQFLREIFSQAIARGLCDTNPASDLKAIAVPQPKIKHYPHLLEVELPDFLNALSTAKSRYISTTAAWMTIFTASRPGMVRFATWEEIDFDNALWSIPAERMKMGSEHITPLCSQLVGLLKNLYQLTGRNEYLFPGNGTKNPTMSENTINKVFRLIGYQGKMVGHGTRHTASTLLREHMWPKDLVEAQLAHKEQGIAGEYNHAVYFDYRRVMMQWYADYLDALKNGLTAEQITDFEKRRVSAIYGLHHEPFSAQIGGRVF